MATQPEKEGDNVSLKEAPTATDVVLLGDDAKKPAALPVPATSIAPPVTDSESIATAQREAMFNKKLAFPLNLTRMLESVESTGYSHVIHWSPGGDSFVICDVDLLLRCASCLFTRLRVVPKLISAPRSLAFLLLATYCLNFSSECIILWCRVEILSCFRLRSA